MVHSIILKWSTATLILLFLINSCKDIRKNNNMYSANPRTNNPTVSFPKSIIDSLSILPEDYSITKESFSQQTGLILSKDIVRQLILSDCNIVFPPGIHIDAYDLEHIFLPRIELSVIGKWIVSDAFETYMIMYTEGLPNDRIYYLVTVKDNSIIATCIMAIDYRDEEIASCNFSSEIAYILCQRLSSNSFIVNKFLNDDNIKESSRFKITDEGRIKLIKHHVQ